MTSNLKPQSLEDLFGNAEQYAEFHLRYVGNVPTTVFLVGSKGPFTMVAPRLDNEEEKSAFAADARLLCVARGATTAVMTLEAWTVLGTPAVPPDLKHPPSLSPNRREMVVLLGEAAGIQKAKFLPILRNASGAFTGFGEAQVLQGSQAQGRFAQILPAQPPTAEEQERAEAILRAKGIVMVPPAAPKPKVRASPRHWHSC